MTTPLTDIFQTRYNEFATSMIQTFPELSDDIVKALSMPATQCLKKYTDLILPAGGRPLKPAEECPGEVLPGVVISPELWANSSKKTQDAINQFLNVLTFAVIMKDGGTENFGGDAFKGWANSFMDDWRSKLNRADFDSFSKRFADLFGSGEDRLPPFPEKLRNGKLVKLAEEIVRELKPEEFGLDPEIMKQCEADPSKAFEVLMNTTMRNPEKLQGAMKRIIKRLQEKFQRGEFNPQELAAEAEEMMKEFSENPAFVKMMESMRDTFGGQGVDAAHSPNNEQTARMSIVRERLRRKAAQQAAGATTMQSKPMASAIPVNTMDDVSTSRTNDDDDGFGSILMNPSKSNAKKQAKK